MIKLIHKDVRHNFPTRLKARWYGAVDNHVYVVYSQPYETESGRSGIEFICKRLEEFSYDYEKELVLMHLKNEKRVVGKPFYSVVDKHNTKVEDIFVSRTIKTYLLAEKLLEKYLKEKQTKHQFKRTKPPKDK